MAKKIESSIIVRDEKKAYEIIPGPSGITIVDITGKKRKFVTTVEPGDPRLVLTGRVELSSKQVSETPTWEELRWQMGGPGLCPDGGV